MNESTADHPWTTSKSMTGMEYTTTLAVLSHDLYTYVERCMKTEDVSHQMTRNDLDRVMKEWLCTSKEEMTREAEARSWDETVDNVWHRIAMCDHLLEFKTWRHDDPKPLRGISYATICQNNSGNYYGKEKQCGRNMAHAYGTRDTRR